MEFDWIWKTVLIVFAGTMLLRIAGRKSISQMTLSQTVIMIAIGPLLIRPVSGKDLWITILIGFVLVLTLIIIEYLQLKFDWFEKMLSGKSKILIENGKIIETNFKHVRMTVDELEMNLRNKGVSEITDVKWATLEPNGTIGVELTLEAKPITMKEFHQLLEQLQEIKNIFQETKSYSMVEENHSNNLFTKKIETNKPPEHHR
ncbi:DUF421 domain-containing protein [Bacillus carboniphilus]|uniref:DUF421 domain-containing protein n=1 Tax=Bacillus carboniphilus TaxID=86663 RepID=A0ABY9JPI2_9BACI|nr:YetF domain-containing protein [Bacillus carboniphilus]WLR41316.1 DUF421 domain-containing protein [Bacillus carboniphilus]